MKFLSKFTTFLLLASLSALIFTSCEQLNIGPNDVEAENAEFLDLVIDITAEEIEEGISSSKSAVWDSCFTFVFPIDVELPDGTTQTVNDQDELETLIATYKDSRPNRRRRGPKIVFPVDITHADGTTESISSSRDLIQLLRACNPDFDRFCGGGHYHSRCADLVFPIDILLPDGSTQTANDEDELKAIFDAWIQANPTDTVNFPSIVYPIQVSTGDTTLTVNNEDELKEALKSCKRRKFKPCFDINFPITVDMPDGTQQAAQDKDEFRSIIETWFTNNPTSEQKPTIAFPFDITLEDGTVQTITSESELETVMADCWGDQMRPGMGRHVRRGLGGVLRLFIRSGSDD